jgi:DNA-binding GntR family transcriptional regulator
VESVLNRSLPRSVQVFELLREQIVTLERRPGETLQKEEIAAALGVSRTPVGDALARLAAIGLATVIPQVGSFVSRIAVVDVIECTFLRRAAESDIARHLAISASAVSLEMIERNLAEQKRLVDAGDWKEMHRVDNAFHKLLAELAGVPGVWEQIAPARLLLERIRYLGLPLPGRLEETYAEHVAIVDAIRRRHLHDSADAMARHLSKIDPYLDCLRARYPQYFVD